MKRRDMVHFLAWLAFIYLLMLGFLYVMQTRMMFFPDPARPNLARNNLGDMRVVTVKTGDGLTLEGWYRPPTDPTKPVILFFHGNAGSMNGRGYKARPFLDAGYGFLFGEYRGFGGNPGAPSEPGLVADSDAWLNFLTRTEAVPPERIVLFGESLGTGIAIRLAARHSDIAALILESPYTSMAALARRTYPIFPVSLLMRNRFDSMEWVGGVRAPTLILHGTNDAVVPYAMGQAVYDALQAPKAFAKYPGGSHIDLFHRGGAQDIMLFLKTRAAPRQKEE